MIDGALDPDTIDAVVFDIGGVFLIPDPVRITAMVTEVGVEIEMDGDDAVRAHYAGIRAVTERFWREGFDESDSSGWRSYDLAYFRAAGVAAADVERAVDAREAHRRARHAVGHVWTHRLDVNVTGFAAVAESRPVAVVSNNDGTAADQCRDHEICQVGEGPHTSVAAIVDSGLIGVAKPDPRIFSPAIDALGTESGRTLYVGDTVHADVRGAEAAGMPVIQLDPFDLHADHDHWRLPDVVALAALLR